MDPDVHVLSYNVGLTNAQVDPQLSGMSPYFFKFTKELRNVIQMAFTRGADTPPLDARSAGADTPSTPAHAVFLCELGSQTTVRRSAPSSRHGSTQVSRWAPSILSLDSATRRTTSLPTSVIS